MARKSKTISEYLSRIGRKGGQAKVPKGAAALTPEERRERGRKAAKVRWDNAKITRNNAKITPVAGKKAS